MDYNSGFNKIIRKRLSKTKEARQGDPLIKRRNNRENRSLMRLNTYLRLLEEGNLDQYLNGYVVYLSPSEFFNPSTNERQDNLHQSLTLGTNCIIYYENRSEWDQFSPLHRGWRQVVENTTVDGDWSGEFAANIKNAVPQILSYIVRTNEPRNHTSFSWMDEEIADVEDRVLNNSQNIGGKGLGNYDYDFCSHMEQKNVCYQLAYLIWNTNGMIEFLTQEYEQRQELWKNKAESRLISNMGAGNYFVQCKKNVERYCKENNLLDINRLIEISAITEESNAISCPLCKTEITADQIFEKVTQDEGRESTANTITEIVLMHIEPLYPGKINHRTYNLGWGHHDCNTFQGNRSIVVTIDRIAEILEKYHR